MYSICDEDQYITSEMAIGGDDIIPTKGAAVETTAILTRAFPRKIRKLLGARLFEEARRYLFKVSTVKDALTAASVGIHRDGVTAMHDATEGGVIAAVLELANASGLGVEVDFENIPISEETREVCKFFRINPLTSLSEGTLIIASRPNRTANVLSKLKSHGIPSHVIGRLTKTGSMQAMTKRGRVRLTYPSFDPYWRAYRKGTTRRWR